MKEVVQQEELVIIKQSTITKILGAFADMPCGKVFDLVTEIVAQRSNIYVPQKEQKKEEKQK